MSDLIDPTQSEGTQAKAARLTGTIRYELLKRKHPEYLEDFWARARAFYKGGVHLLESDAMMNRVFPQQVREDDVVYAMRKQLAHYTNHAGAITNHLLSKLMTDPARMQASPDPDDFYEKFMKDCSPPNGEEVSINDLLGKVFLNAAQCKTGYALVEMPENLETEAKSLAEQEAAGALNAWCVNVAPESVVDWEVDKAGEYLWVLLCFKSKKRADVFEERNTISEEYWLYNRTGWIRWDITYREETPPNEKDGIQPTAAGTHTFKKVPLVKLDLPDGLWVMSKLESLAREYFNKRNALSWAEFKALLPVLYEFLDPGMMPQMPGPAGDDNRATAQVRSVAHVLQRQAAPGQGDRAEWIGPPDAPFGHALTSCDSVRDEMHRVVQQMALSADTKGAMLKRSEGSKRQDSVALDVVLGEYGKFGRKFLIALVQIVEAGRGDEPREWAVSGLSKFETASTAVVVEEETVLDAVEMPSPTFKAERKKQLARVVLGDSVAEKKLAEIDKEIEDHYSFEGELAEAGLTREGFHEARLAEVTGGEGEDDEDDEDDGEDDDVDNNQKKPRKKKMIMSTFKGDKA